MWKLNQVLLKRTVVLGGLKNGWLFNTWLSALLSRQRCLPGCFCKRFCAELKWAHQLILVRFPGRWNWTAKCWRWWTIKRSQTSKEAACLRPNICSSPVTRWPSSSLRMLKLQAASDLWPLQHGLKWLELWCCFLLSCNLSSNQDCFSFLTWLMLSCPICRVYVYTVFSLI